MKTTTLFTLAAALGEATASFRNAKSFSCPSNTPETCDTQQEQGFDWSGLADGAFSNFGGLDFTGFTCKSGSLGKRDSLTGRTFGGKTACGVAQIGGGSSFGCGSSGQVDKFSISHFDISVEFDTDLEFHYDMADGSKCKHRSSCSKSGSTVKNTQCGGAKNVTIVYPSQSSKPSSTCSFSMHTIGFSCGTPTATTIVATTSAATTSTEIQATTTSTTGETTSTAAVGTTSSTATETTTSVSETTTSEVVDTTSTSTSVETTTSEVVDTTSTSVETTTSEVAATTSPVTSTLITTYIGTSTVFTTSVVTVTSCGPTVTNCPAGNHNNTVVLVTQTIAVSTTVCPITETQTTVIDTTTAVETSSTKAVETTSKTKTTAVADTTSTEAVATTSSQAPIETLPCPDVVPSCLNTWLFTVGCTDNTDHSCYCPSAVFVENIFSCIYSYGESDDIIQQAVVYFQGICADHAGSNPAIVTGAETVTTVITVTPTAAPTSGDYTTVTVVATTVVPCEESGTTIAGSSSTVVVSTEMTVPQVTFQTTIEAGATTSDVVLAPVVTTGETGAIATGTGAGETTLYTRPSTTVAGTGVLATSTSTNLPVQFTGAASPRGVAFGAIAFGVAGAIVGL